MTPRWLSPQEHRTWLYALTAVQLVEGELDRRMQREAGMPLAYYMLLAGLSEAPEQTMRMGDLAAFTNASQSRLSHAVRRLERQGWVRRRRHPADGRVVLAVLTDEGYRVLAAAAPGHVSAVRELMFDHLEPADLAALQDVAARLLAGVDRSGAARALLAERTVAPASLGSTDTGPDSGSDTM
jgi:DNA-binding MarR family transcriptional regulator